MPYRGVSRWVNKLAQHTVIGYNHTMLNIDPSKLEPFFEALKMFQNDPWLHDVAEAKQLETDLHAAQAANNLAEVRRIAAWILEMLAEGKTRLDDAIMLAGGAAPPSDLY
jgi:hypothetical protein